LSITITVGGADMPIAVHCGPVSAMAIQSAINKASSSESHHRKRSGVRLRLRKTRRQIKVEGRTIRREAGLSR
jgi:hypothetical protein